MGVDHVPLQDFTMDLVLTLMYMTTENMEVQLCPRYEAQLNVPNLPPPPHPVPSPVRPHNTHHYSTADGRAETDRLD